MEVKLIDMAAGQSKSTIKLSDDVFGADYNESLVHQVVVSYMAGGRSGTKSQKTRSEVSGSGVKPWRQKGTGRARAGTIRSPIWVGGGVTFASKPRDFSHKVNKKMYKAALRSILSELNRNGRLIVVDDFKIDAPKTKEFKAKLSATGVNEALVVTEAFDEYLYLASRNLYHSIATDVAAIDPLSLIGYKNVVMTQAAIKQLEERLA